MKSLPVALKASLLTILLLEGCTFLALGAEFPNTVLSQNPVGYWRLNELVQPPAPQPAANLGALGAEGEGRYVFGPRRGEPGALSDSTATSVRFFNTSFDIGFGGSKVEVPYNAALNPSNAFSVEFWAKPTSVVTNSYCMVASIDSDPAIGATTNSSPRTGWLFYQSGSLTNLAGNQWQFRLGNTEGYLDGDLLRGGTITTGAWHHIVGTFDGATAALFVNGTQVASHPIDGFRPNGARPFRIGTTTFDGILGAEGTYAGNRGFDGWLDEVALYNTALTPADITAHYDTARTNGTAYASLVLTKKPVGFWRLGEPGNPPAANLGTLGTNGLGRYIYAAHPGQGGPQPPTFPGLESDNRACGFAGTNGFVDLPALNLNTNTVTITAWILPTTIQTNNAAIVFCRLGTTVAGLKFDVNDPNGLSYNWNNDAAAYNFKSGLVVPVFQWCFVALIVQPDQATLCLQDGTQFSTAVNFAVHPEQAFEGDTLIGRDLSDSSLTFNGIIDEVAIFDRALTVGEVFSQFASAAGGLKPRIFAEVQPPSAAVYVGDTLTLRVDAGGTPPLSYQWRKDGAPIPGATSSTFVKTGADRPDSGNYEVVISNAGGSITSQLATVEIQPLSEPTISQSSSGRTIYSSGLLSLTVLASGGGLSYQWQKDAVNIPGATNATFEVPAVSGNDSGAYQVVVSNRLNTTRSTVADISVIVPAADSFEAAIVHDRPESWWRLDDAKGGTTLTDALGRHDGVYQGGVTLGVPGVLGGETNRSVSFDGSSGYAEVPFTKALNTTNFTIECWVKAQSFAPALTPVASFTQPPGRGYLIQKSSDGEWYYMFGDGSDPAVFVVSGSDVTYEKWTYLAVTYDSTNYSAYVNGTLDAQADPFLVPNNVAPLRIGLDQKANGWNDYWLGEIDEVAFYPTALSADQIAAHYAAALYGPKSEPVFIEQPESKSAPVGSFSYFTSTVEGSVPLRLQWNKDGVPLPNQTNSYIIFNTLTFKDSGVYQLSASNLVANTLSAPATLAVVPPPAFANLTNSLVLHLNFEGNYLDSSGHTNHAKPLGSPTFVDGRVGTRALNVRTEVDDSNPNDVFVTAADFLTLGNPRDLQFGTDVSFSISYWVRFEGAPGDLPFFCNTINAYGNPGYTFAPSFQAGGWSWSLGDMESGNFIGIYGDSNSINDAQWHHLVHTFDRNGIGITYLDGDRVDSRSIVPAGNLDTGEQVSIGQDATGEYPEPGEMDIDDLGVWRRILTPFEVSAIYSAGKSGTSFDTYGPVSLAVTADGTQVQLMWQAGTLLESEDLRGPWLAVPGAAAPYFKVPAATVPKFYRVRL